MSEQKLIDYINAEIDKGTPIENIKQNLIDNGWKEEIVNNAINSAIQVDSPKKKADSSVDPRFLIAWIVYCIIAILLEIFLVVLPEFFPLMLACCGNILLGWTVFNFIIFFVFLSKKKDKNVLQLIGAYLIGYAVLLILQIIQLVIFVINNPNVDPFAPGAMTTGISVPWVFGVFLHLILLVMSIRLYKKQRGGD